MKSMKKRTRRGALFLKGRFPGTVLEESGSHFENRFLLRTVPQEPVPETVNVLYRP